MKGQNGSLFKVSPRFVVCSGCWYLATVAVTMLRMASLALIVGALCMCIVLCCVSMMRQSALVIAVIN